MLYDDEIGSIWKIRPQIFVLIPFGLFIYRISDIKWSQNLEQYNMALRRKKFPFQKHVTPSISAVDERTMSHFKVELFKFLMVFCDFGGRLSIGLKCTNLMWNKHFCFLVSLIHISCITRIWSQTLRLQLQNRTSLVHIRPLLTKLQPFEHNELEKFSFTQNYKLLKSIFDITDIRTDHLI